MLLTPLFAAMFPIIAFQSAPETPAPEAPPNEASDVVVTAPERPICRERGTDMGSNIRRRQQTCITREQAEEEQRRAVRAHGELNTALGQAGYAARAAAGGEGPAPAPAITP